MAVDVPAPLVRLLSGTTISQLFRHVSLDQQQNLPLLALASVITIFVTSTVVKVVRGIMRVNYVTGYRRPFFPYSIPGLMLPTSFWSPGYYFLWRWRVENYKRFKSELFSFVGLLGGEAIIFTNNLDIMRQVAGGPKSDFHKPLSASRGLIQWGLNLAAAPGGEEWRKHRRIMGPAFSNNLYRMVWKKSADIYREMCTVEGWNDKQVVDVTSVQKYTFQFALLVIGACGFGFNFSWSDPPVTADGSMSLQRALQLYNDRQVTTLVPKWVANLPIPYFREYNQAKAKLTEWMKMQVAERKALVRGNTEGHEVAGDCFTLLVKANEDEEKKYKLTDDELIGNVFVLLFAGHETTAHTFAATLANLAIQPELQDEILEQIISVVGWKNDPEFEDYPKLNKVLAAFYEALRMFPAGHLMFRQALKDTTLQIPNPPGQEGTTPLVLPEGAMVVVDMVGVQYNDRYFDEPEKFKPSRWYNTPMDSDGFSAFSLGPRACIGRKFATTEAVSMLSLLLRDWKVEPLLNPGETIEQWKTRVIDAELFITLGIRSVPVRFIRRPERA